MLGSPAGGQPMIGGTPWGTPPFVPAYGGVPAPPFVGGGTPAIPVLGGVPPPRILWAGVLQLLAESWGK